MVFNLYNNNIKIIFSQQNSLIKYIIQVKDEINEKNDDLYETMRLDGGEASKIRFNSI